MKELKSKYISALLKPRLPDSHKGTYGHALIIAGNEGKMGAVVIASRACLRSGVGLLTVNVPKDERFILQNSVPEAMLKMREDFDFSFENFSAIAIGPGLGTDKNSVEILVKTFNKLKKNPKPLLLDADALNIIAENTNLFEHIPIGTILTPHPKEFDRLFGTHKNTSERIKTAIEKSKELQLVIVLKGHKTLVTNSDESYINTTGNAGLAKGGSGDALTGIITAFLAQGYNSFEAAQLGIYIHGLAADLTLNAQSMESMIITDVIENLGKAFMAISNQQSAFSSQL